ncbi:hypothetical protein AAC387_Pa01g2105 [Persea americana]
MGVYRHLLGDPGSIDNFRDLYKVPANVEVRSDDPDDRLTYRDGWMPFWLVSVVEGGIRFPLHPLVRDCLWEWRLCPCQLLPNGYKIIMGVVRLNQILKIGLGVPNIEDTYDLCKSAEGDTYYLRLRVRWIGFVTALEDSNKFPRKEGACEEEPLEGEQRVARAGEKLPRPQLSCCVVSPGVRAPLPVLQHLQKGIGNRLRAERGRRQSSNSDDRGARNLRRGACRDLESQAPAFPKEVSSFQLGGRGRGRGDATPARATLCCRRPVRGGLRGHRKRGPESSSGSGCDASGIPGWHSYPRRRDGWYRHDWGCSARRGRGRLSSASSRRRG